MGRHRKNYPLARLCGAVGLVASALPAQADDGYKLGQGVRFDDIHVSGYLVVGKR